MRLYTPFPQSRRHILAFWVYSWLTFGPGGRLALDGPTPALFRHITDGPTVRLDEVPR